MKCKTGPKPIPLRVRFFKHVLQKSNDQCWEWTARRNSDGYGMIGRYHGRQVMAHRVSWEIANGRRVKGKRRILHSCDNPGCVNPKHLFIGSQADNVRDMVSKGRGKDNRGEQNGRSKLNEADVLSIRRLLQEGRCYEELAERFGVSDTVIYTIKHNVSWRHVK